MSMGAPLPKSRLGRGLASLIGEPANAPVRPPEGESRTVGLAEIKAGRLNPRRDFREEELEELSSSIRQRGLVQPILVRPAADGGYEIVAGERRWRACQRAGLHNIPVIIRELSDQEVLELAIIENVQRADLNAIEEAGGYRDLIEQYGYTQDRLAEVIGKSRSHLANTLRLLKLPETVQMLVQQGLLTAGHARALVGRDDAEVLARRIIDRGLNVREIEAIVAAGPINDDTSTRSRDKDADTRAFEREVSDAIGLKCEIKRGAGESGVLNIKYSNYDQLEYIKLRLTNGSTGGQSGGG